MPIVAASVVPHSPLLLPSIAKQHTGLFAQTTTSVTILTADWYAAKPDIVIILSPHGLPKGQDIVIHSAENFSANFTEYGDIATTFSAVGALGVMHQIKSAAEREHLPLHLQTFDRLDYGTSVPLSFLLPSQPKLPVCSILVGTKEPNILLRLAAVLREFVNSDRHRFLILASCDMTRRAEHNPDTNRRPTAEERAFSSSIVAVDSSQLTAVVSQRSTCGFGPLLVLVSLLSGVADHGEVTSFEAPLGVGLLTASFSINA